MMSHGGIWLPDPGKDKFLRPADEVSVFPPEILPSGGQGGPGKKKGKNLRRQEKNLFQDSKGEVPAGEDLRILPVGVPGLLIPAEVVHHQEGCEGEPAPGFPQGCPEGPVRLGTSQIRGVGHQHRPGFRRAGRVGVYPQGGQAGRDMVRRFGVVVRGHQAQYV